MATSIARGKDSKASRYSGLLLLSLTAISDYNIEITIFEGKKRQIRRMLEKLGNRVLSLNRIAIGKLELYDYSLNPGQYMEVTRDEIMSKITAN